MPIITRKEFKNFAKERVNTFLLIGSTLLALVNTFIVILQVQSSDLQVPVRYTEYSYNLDRGSWTILYELALFSIVIVIVNTILAIKLRHIRKLYSISMLVLTLFLMIITLLVTNALVGLIAA